MVENALYRVEFSNRGAVVKSWQLKKYTDDSKPPRILDVVHPHAAETAGWPFAVVLNDEQQQNTANSALYQMATASNVAAPTDVDFSWSDGHLEITKHFHFENSYVMHAEVSAKYDGKPIAAGLGWLVERALERARGGASKLAVAGVFLLLLAPSAWQARRWALEGRYEVTPLERPYPR